MDTSEFEGDDDYERFMAAALGSNNQMWGAIFDDLGETYQDPELVLFRGSTDSACGGARSSFGPHYCPADQTIYIDETFYTQLEDQFGARGGDVAEAYVVSHEVGHHVQYLLGDLENIYDGSKTNQESIDLELQADCFAGLWAYSLRDLDVFEAGEFAEAIDAAKAVGDDNIQSSTTGDIDQSEWTHGSSRQRQEWLNRGYESGDLSSCGLDS